MSLNLLSLLLMATSAFGDTTENEELSMRNYDLSVFMERGPNVELRAPLLPGDFGSGFYDQESPMEESRALEGDRVVDLIRRCVEPSVWDEDPRCELHLYGEEGRLLRVRAPTRVQDRVADFLRFLQENFVTRQRVDIRIIAGRNAGAQSSFLGIKAADQLIAGMLQDGTAKLEHQGSVRVSSQRVQYLKEVLLRQYVYDWEVEIAQGATIADEVLKEVPVGLRCWVRAHPAEGGTYVDLAFQQSADVGPVHRLELGTQSVLSTKNGLETSTTIGLIEHPSIGFVSFAGSMLIPAGKALLLPFHCMTDAGPVSFLAEIRISGEPWSVHSTRAFRLHEMEAGAEDSGSLDAYRPFSCQFARLGVTVSPGIRIEHLPSALFETSESIDEAVGGGYRAATFRSNAEDSGEINMDSVVNNLNSLLPDDELGLRFINPFSDCSVILGLTDQELQRVRPALDSFADPGPTYEVAGRIVNASGKEISTFRFPMLLRRPSTVWSGVHCSRVMEWDVDVANESSVCNPEIREVMDGFALRVEARTSPDGSLVLEVDGKLHFLRGPLQKKDLSTRDRRILESYDADSKFLHDERILPAAGGELKFPDSVLSLELTVTRSS